MITNFTIWLEIREQERKIRSMLLTRLGYKPDSVEALDNDLSEKPLDDYETALKTMGLDPDTVAELINFVKENQGSTIGDLLQQIDQLDLPEKEEPAAPARPAAIPPGQFIPKQPQQQQMPPKMIQQPPPMG